MRVVRHNNHLRRRSFMIALATLLRTPIALAMKSTLCPSFHNFCASLMLIGGASIRLSRATGSGNLIQPRETAVEMTAFTHEPPPWFLRRCECVLAA